MNLGATLISFLGGGMAAWGVGQFWTHRIVHPVISVRLDQRSGCLGTMPLYENNTYLHDAKFIRLFVENTGLSTIKDCCGYITKVAKLTDTEWHSPNQEIFTLGWAYYPPGSTARSIPRGAFFHMDVIQLYLKANGEKELKLPYFPTTLIEFFRGKGSYKAWILIAADNAKPREIEVEFTCDPERDELTATEGNWESYPWWKRWWIRLRHWWEPWWDRLRHWWEPWWRWLRSFGQGRM